MTGEHTIEAACWRIWYRLKERGCCSMENLMANCGVDSETFEEAFQAMKDMGMVQRARTEEVLYELRVEEPRMMQVFPTIWSSDE